MKFFSGAAIAACSLMLTGCATIFGGGTSQSVNLVSSDGKTHTVSVQAPGQAAYDVDIPKAIPVNRSSKDIIVVVKDSPDGNIAPTNVESKMNPWFMGDVVALSLLSSSIDCLSGAAWRYDDNATVNVTKEAVESAQKAKDAEKAKKRASVEDN